MEVDVVALPVNAPTNVVADKADVDGLNFRGVLLVLVAELPDDADTHTGYMVALVVVSLVIVTTGTDDEDDAFPDKAPTNVVDDNAAVDGLKFNGELLVFALDTPEDTGAHTGYMVALVVVSSVMETAELEDDEEAVDAFPESAPKNVVVVTVDVDGLKLSCVLLVFAARFPVIDVVHSGYIVVLVVVSSVMVVVVVALVVDAVIALPTKVPTTVASPDALPMVVVPNTRETVPATVKADNVPVV